MFEEPGVTTDFGHLEDPLDVTTHVWHMPTGTEDAQQMGNVSSQLDNSVFLLCVLFQAISINKIGNLQ